MTEGEKMVWAAAYAAEFTRAVEQRLQLGGDISVASCIEHAWSAVVGMREAYGSVFDGWGEGQVVDMLDEILR